MRALRRSVIAAALAALLAPAPVGATDHNDPDKINAIFPDIEPSPADIYGLMAWPEDAETIAVVLTWADAEYDRDILYQIKFDAERADTDGFDLTDLDVFGLFERLAGIAVDEERTVSARFGRAKAPVPGEPLYAVELRFDGFDLDQNVARFPVETEVALPIGGEQVFAFAGRRDDPFFIDLIGFFDSIWYGHPPGPEETWGVEDKTRSKGLFARAADGTLVTNELGRPQFVYDSDNDEQAGLDVHSLVLRIPRRLVADDDHPIVNVWSETRKVEG